MTQRRRRGDDECLLAPDFSHRGRGWSILHTLVPFHHRGEACRRRVDCERTPGGSGLRSRHHRKGWMTPQAVG
jgi:hypothetical protein